MDGVMILNTYQNYTFGWALVLTFFIAFFGLSVIASLVTLEDGILLSTLFAGLAAIAIIVCFNIPKTQTTFEVVIGDNVPINEFLEHYKIHGERGKIFRVTEREENNGQGIHTE